jgi:hypothetical protein
VQRSFSFDTPSIVAPQAQADAATVAANSSANPINVVANDLNASGVAVTLPSATSAQGGSLTLSGGGSVSYSPPAGFSGQDSFSYQLANCAGTSRAAVTVTVTAAAVGPIAQDAQINVSPGGPTSIDMSPFVRNATSISLVSAPKLGSATVSGLRVTYTPSTQFATRDSFSYLAQGPNGTSTTATVTLLAGALNSGLVTQGEVFRLQTHHISNAINRRIGQLMAPRPRGGLAAVGDSSQSWLGQTEQPTDTGLASQGTLRSNINLLRSGVLNPTWEGSAADNDRISRRDGLQGGSEGIGMLASLLGMGSDLSVSSSQASLDLPNKWLGIAGGDQPGSWGGWGNLTYTQLENNLAASRYDGHLYSLIAGADYRLSKDLWLGASLAYEDSNIDTDYNDGRAKNEGFVFTPYLAYTFFRGDDSSLGLSLMAGYGSLSNDTSRNLSLSPVTGSFDSDRWMLEADLNWYKLVDSWSWHGFGGYLWADQETDNFSESDGTQWSKRKFHLRELKLGGEASYRLNDAFEPYLRATYYYNFGGTNLHLSYDPLEEVDQELELLVGFNWTPRPDTTASFEIGHGFLNDELDTTSVMLNLKMEF